MEFLCASFGMHVFIERKNLKIPTNSPTSACPNSPFDRSVNIDVEDILCSSYQKKCLVNTELNKTILQRYIYVVFVTIVIIKHFIRIREKAVHLSAFLAGGLQLS